MSSTDIVSPDRTAGAGAARTSPATLDAGWLLVGLFLFLGVQNLLLWRFLDFAPPWLYALAAAGLAGVALLLRRVLAEGPGSLQITRRTLLVCALAALALCALGGEGNLFFANVDWQVRNALLDDLIAQHWPYAYTHRGPPEILRAPLAMYLAPALVGKVAGAQAAHVALLVQNAAFLTVVLAAASTLFESLGKRLLALAVFVFFSGMDVVGHGLATLLSPDYVMVHHVEGWASVQYSSHLTQIFWVPHHALSGWLAATLFLLWRSGVVRVGVFLAFVPLLLLWSPLVAIGTMPFALYAGLSALIRRCVRLADVALPLGALILSVPVILYLGADNGKVGNGLFAIPPINYTLFQALEVLPFVAGILLLTLRPRLGRGTLALAAACLLLIPFFQVGENIDFAMRASIPSLAILAVMTIDALHGGLIDPPNPFRRWVAYGLAAVLAVGAVTGLLEIVRAVANRPAPPARCSMIGAWEQQDLDIKMSQLKVYIAPVDTLPASIRPIAPALVPDTDPPRCWYRAWKVAR